MTILGFPRFIYLPLSIPIALILCIVNIRFSQKESEQINISSYTAIKVGCSLLLCGLVAVTGIWAFHLSALIAIFKRYLWGLALATGFILISLYGMFIAPDRWWYWWYRW